MEHMMEPNFIAILVAIIVSFGFGWLWYGPLFGKKLMAQGGMTQHANKALVWSLTIIGLFLTTFIMSHLLMWHHVSMGMAMGAMERPFYVHAFCSGFCVWLGFYLPMCLGKVCWDGKSWSVFGIHALFSFLNLQIIAMILAYMH